MASHSTTLAWKIPWMEEAGRLQSMGSLRVGHDWVTSLLLFTFMHWRRKWHPTPVLLPGESRHGGAWWAADYGVAQIWTGLKRLSSSSSSNILYFVAKSWLMIKKTLLSPLSSKAWEHILWKRHCIAKCAFHNSFIGETIHKLKTMY